MLRKFFLIFKSHFPLVQNTFWLYLSEITSKSLHILFFLLVARLLGKETLGIFSYTLSLASFYFLFSDFGLSQLLIRDYHQKEDKLNVLKTSFSFKFLISLLVTLLSFSGYLILKNKEYSFSLYFILVIYMFVYSLRVYLNSFFITTYRSFLNFIASLIEGISIVLLFILFIFLHRSSLSIGLAYLLSSLLTFVFSFLFFIRLTNFKLNYLFSFDKQEIKTYFLNGLPLVFFGMLGYIFFSTDQLILGHFRSFEEVGLYAAGSKIVLAMSFLGYLLSTALLPLISKAIFDLNKFRKYFLVFVWIHFFFGLISTLFLLSLSPLIVYLTFGPEFMDSLPYIYLLSWILVFMFPTNFLDAVLFSFNKQWLDFGITLIPALFNLIFNLYFVPTYGAYGAILGSLLAQFLNFLLSLGSVYFVLQKQRNLKTS